MGGGGGGGGGGAAQINVKCMFISGQLGVSAGTLSTKAHTGAGSVLDVGALSDCNCRQKTRA